MAAPRRAAVAPGPRGHWLVGSNAPMQCDPLGLLTSARQQFGDIVRFRYFGPLGWFFFAHPREIERVLSSHAQNYPKGVFSRVVAVAVGDGLLANDGAVWRQHRRLIQPGFHLQRVAGFAAHITHTTDAMLERWRRRERPSDPLDLHAEMMRLTMEIAGHTLFSADIRGNADLIDEFLRLALDQITYWVLHPLSPLAYVPSLRSPRYRRAAARIDRTIQQLIDKRRRVPAGETDLLAMLLEQRDDTGEGLSDAEIRDEVKTLLIAGYETTGVTVSWAWHLIGGHPAVEERMRCEIDRVLAGRTPVFEDVEKLRYTRQIIEEALRLYPPAPWFGRQARNADEVGGYVVPKGSVVAVSPFVTHRHPDFWSDPDAFDPERFSDARAGSRPRFAYFPFGAGPRQCIGYHFAMLEAQLILATVAQRCRLTPLDTGVVKPQFRGTLHPLGGLPARVHMS